MTLASVWMWSGCTTKTLSLLPPAESSTRLTSDITALFGVRVVVEALGSLVAHGKLGAHKALIDKPVAF